MNNSSKIRAKQNEINALKKQLIPIKKELNAFYEAWDSSDRKSGTSRIVYVETEYNRLLNQIHAKKQELRILKGDAQPGRVPAWKGHRDEVGLECF